MFFFSSLSIARLEGVERILADVVREALSNSPIDFMIADHGGVRTAEEQNSLFKKGASKCDGFHKISKHQTGDAVDIVPIVEGKTTTDNVNAYCIVAGSILSTAKRRGVDITWGGTFNSKKWNGWDKGHFELK